MNISLSRFAPENLVSRDVFGRPVPRQPLLILHTRAEYSAYSRDPSRYSRRRPFIYLRRHTPSGQSRVYRVTQLRTDDVHWPLVLSACPLHTNSGCGKERRILIGPWRPAKEALVRNYLEIYWPCAGGPSAVNAIGTQLRDRINSGLTRWRMAVS